MFSRATHVVLTLVVLVLFYHGFHISQQHGLMEAVELQVTLLPDGKGTPESQYLSRLSKDFGLTSEVEWQSWRIRPVEEMSAWTSVAAVRLKFGGNKRPRIVNVTDPNSDVVNVKRRMELPVHASPVFGRLQASEFLFGISTSYERLSANEFAMMRSWSRWLTDGRHKDNGATIIVILTESSDSELESVDDHLQAFGIDAYVTTTEGPMSSARRHHELSRILASFSSQLAADGQIKTWFGLVEDEVFFPSLALLRERLFEYNGEKEHYIALPSEREDWVEGKAITYGGGAILFTRPALLTINKLRCFEGQHESEEEEAFKGKSWDRQMQDCIFKQTNMKLHVLPGFYSPLEEGQHGSKDFNSYETGVQPLVLHNTEQRHGLGLHKAHLVANVCGEACFMQRYVFHDDWVLVNGVSISHYPKGMSQERRPPAESPVAAAAGRVIVDSGGADETVMITPKKGQREVWTLLDSSLDTAGMVYQAYVKRAPEGSKKPDSVIVLLWEAAVTREL